MKKSILITLIAGLGLLFGCQDVTVGYLQTENAVYVPDTLVVRTTLDATLDAYRIYNVSPWVSPKMQGVIGTNPLLFEVAGVTTNSEGGNAEMFRHLLKIRGGGRMELPLITNVPAGRYVVSVRVYNEGYSEIIQDAFTFIVE